MKQFFVAFLLLVVAVSAGAQTRRRSVEPPVSPPVQNVFWILVVETPEQAQADVAAAVSTSLVVYPYSATDYFVFRRVVADFATSPFLDGYSYELLASWPVASARRTAIRDELHPKLIEMPDGAVALIYERL